jgi:hypothetical protein
MQKETKKQRFKRVAEKRVQNILKALQSLSALSNKKVYEWEQGQLEKIWRALDRELETCKNSFKNPEANTFRL